MIEAIGLTKEFRIPVKKDGLKGSIVFLDEPTIGLDIGTKESMRELIKKINKERGVTVILTSHDLKDVEDICQRIIVIDGGNVVCDENIDQLYKAYPMNRGISITLAGTSKNLLDEIRLLNGITYAEMQDSYSIDIDFSPDKYTAFELVQVVNSYDSVIDFKLRDPSIERMIEQIYRTGEKRR